MSDQANVMTDNISLARYTVLLILDPARLRDFVDYPESRAAEMAAAGLSEEEIGLLTGDGVVELCEYLKWQVPGPGPVPPDPPPPPIEDS